MDNLKYVLITPAHNEEAFIGATIQSIVAQTLRPLKWVIVNDGSADKTRDVVETYAPFHDFIVAVNLVREPGRNFSRKVIAFNRGLAEVASLEYDFVGNLDADITVAPEYFQRMLDRFRGDSRLGLTGGIVFTKIGTRFITHDKTEDSVAGAVQLFRKACFEDIRGYRPLSEGGIDAVAEILARRQGWKVRKSLDDSVFEHRRTGTASMPALRSNFQLGRRFYLVGYSALFFFLRCIYRAADRPILFGSAAEFLGYLSCLVRGRSRSVPQDVVEYLRTEQKRKLLDTLSKVMGRTSRAKHYPTD